MHSGSFCGITIGSTVKSYGKSMKRDAGNTWSSTNTIYNAEVSFLFLKSIASHTLLRRAWMDQLSLLIFSSRILEALIQPVYNMAQVRSVYNEPTLLFIEWVAEPFELAPLGITVVLIVTN